MNKSVYEFGAFVLDVDGKRLRRGSERILLQPKVFDLLVCLVERHGELVSRDELMEIVWADTFVEESNVRLCVHALRKALGRDDEGREFIETIPKRGYRFSSKVVMPAPRAKSDDDAPRSSVAGSRSRRLAVGLPVLLLSVALISGFVWMRYQKNAQKAAPGFGRLAVLPFETAFDNGRAIQIGLLDSTIANLSRIPGMEVLPTASVQGLAGQTLDPQQSGREIGAESVLTGSYRIEGGIIKVSARILRVSDGDELWSAGFDAKGESDAEFENSAALRLARLISLNRSEAAERILIANQNRNEVAVQNYLSARKIWRSGELFRREEMIGLFVKAIAAEPDWATVYAGYAEAMVASDQLFVDWPKVRETSLKALELDPALAAPHSILGEYYRWKEWNWGSAEDNFKKAIALDPEQSPNYQRYSEFLRLQRRFAEAEEQLGKAIAIDPFVPAFHASSCDLYLQDRKIDKALASCRTALWLDPENWRAPKLLYWIYLKEKMYPELEKLALAKLSASERAANPLARSIAQNDLRPYFQSLLDAQPKNGVKETRPITKATYYVQLGDNEKALESLERALEERDPAFPNVNADPIFDPIRNDARFVEMMRKIGLQR